MFPRLALLIAALLTSSSAQLKTQEGVYGPRLDFAQYAQPTITAVGPVSFLPGKVSRIHVHVQYRHAQYVGSATSWAEVYAAGLKVGATVDLREQGKDLYLRPNGHHRWLKLRLVTKGCLSNL